MHPPHHPQLTPLFPLSIRRTITGLKTTMLCGSCLQVVYSRFRSMSELRIRSFD
jgi:hypothetical protein